MCPLRKSTNESKMNRLPLPEARATSLNAIPASEEIFRQMTDNIQEIFWMLDATSYEVIYVSPGFEAICGISCQTVTMLRPFTRKLSIRTTERVFLHACMNSRRRAYSRRNSESFDQTVRCVGFLIAALSYARIRET